MKILDVRTSEMPGVVLVRYGRYRDERGYFCETMRRSILAGIQNLPGDLDVPFVQCNESFSRAGTIRGLHVQWDPPMGKLVRTVAGRMIDLLLDLRRSSAWYGRVVAYDLPARPEAEYGEWVWVPPGVAHGGLYPVDGMIEYFCTAEYNPACEGGVTPLAPDLDWSFCDAALRKVWEETVARGPIMSAKDRVAPALAGWAQTPQSSHRIFE